MRERKDAGKPRLVELSLAPDIWVDGFGIVEELGDGVYRIPLYKIRRPPEGEGDAQHEIVAYVLANLRNIEDSLMGLRDGLVTRLLGRVVNQVH